jgi:hypothetical protein
MKRGFLNLAALGVLCALLAGCDKCTGGLQELRFPQAPNVCSGDTAR